MTGPDGRIGRELLIPALVLAGGLLLAAAIGGAFFHSAHKPERTVSVTGASSRTFDADLVKWRLSLARPVGDADLPSGFAQVQQDLANLRAQLMAAGVPDSAIIMQPPSAQPVYSQQGRSGYNVMQPLYVLSADIDQVESIALDPSRFLTSGMALEYSQLEYFFAGIAELKHALLGDATRDAKRRAEEIVGSTGGTVGGVTRARAGVFQITEPFSTEVSSFGVHNTSTRRKEITVTVHSEFRIR
jgi:uncharacterized protein